MKKKKRTRKKKTYKPHRLFFIITFLVIFAVAFIGINLAQKQKTQKDEVLGSLIAKDGDDSGSSSGSGSEGNDSGPSQSSGSDSSGSSGSDSSGDSTSDTPNSGSDLGTNDSGSGASSGSSDRTDSSDVLPTRSRLTNPTTGIRTQTEVKQDEQKSEIRLSEEERIRTRTKDGRTRIDITADGVKTRLEIRDDRIVIKAEMEDGTEVELEDDTIFKIEERLGSNQIKIATDEANRIVIQRGQTAAVSQFPLSIDLATNTLIVDTPSGQKNLTVLPDQVIQNLIVANVVNRLGGTTVVNSFRTGEVSTLSQVLTLGEKNGFPIYEINGISDQRLLGFIPVAIEKTVEVSAQTGEILTTQISPVNRVIDLISF